MKSKYFITALLLCSALFISCTNTDTDEELQLLIDNQEFVADDTGEYPPPPMPPDPEEPD
ncbi:MAG: hypothetical protein COC16_05610 [Lutibacter sp.]|nr:MAG: hypothetical protein COC16_05610 [Lutibacter sp.]